MVAAQTLSVYSDKFFGQWLMMHVPFLRAEDFMLNEIRDLVPAQRNYFSVAMCCEHPAATSVWSSDAAMDEHMKIEGHCKKLRLSFVNMVKAQRNLIAEYVNGLRNAGEEQLERNRDLEKTLSHAALERRLQDVPIHLPSRADFQYEIGISGTE